MRFSCWFLVDKLAYGASMRPSIIFLETNAYRSFCRYSYVLRYILPTFSFASAGGVTWYLTKNGSWFSKVKMLDQQSFLRNVRVFSLLCGCFWRKRRCSFLWLVFFRRDISVIFPVLVEILAVRVFTTLPFRTLSPNWLKFFFWPQKKIRPSIENNLGCDTLKLIEK